MAADQQEYVGWQFRFVFEDQDNRRAAWSTVLKGEPTFTSGYRSYNGWQRRYYYEVRRVYAAVVEPYVEDPHHKPATPGVKVPFPIPEPWPQGAHFADEHGNFYDERANAVGVTAPDHHPSPSLSPP